MERAENVASCHAENIIWKDNALAFHFPKSKGDQHGKRANALWHVYATPENPATCPHLALARYLFANPGVLTGEDTKPAKVKTENKQGWAMSDDIAVDGRLLFPGGNQYDRFMYVFHKVINNNEEAFRNLGVGPGDLGSHSARKGSCTFASSGTTASPPIASICLRAMWSMGPVKERYLHYEKAGDQYVGRVVSGLNSCDASFAISPPHFDFTRCADPQVEKERIHGLLRSFLIGGDMINPRLFRIFVNLFATLCFHNDYLRATLHKRNKLHASPFFTQIPSDILKLAVVRFPWDSNMYTPPFSGIPPHVTILANLRGLKEDVKELRHQVHKDFVEEMDERGIGGVAYLNQKKY